MVAPLPLCASLHQPLLARLRMAVMNESFDSTDRGPKGFLMFALAFIGFLLAGGGIILLSAALAAFGAVVFLLSILSFRHRRALSE